MSRRAWLRAIAHAGAAAGAFAGAGGLPARLLAREAEGPQSPRAAVAFAAASPDTRLRFPRDHGAHPAFRTEWWYLTGWLRAGELAFGVQITFFRARTAHAETNPSRFAPRQLLLAHAALALPGEPRLLHDQRAARIGFGLAEAGEGDCNLRLDDWSLARSPDDRYSAQVRSNRFHVTLALRPPGPPLLRGDEGFSRKGPGALQASHYYSRPQLAMNATVVLRGDANERPRELAASGTGWFDHEWSSELLDPRAVGWDWIGINLDDGSALMAFRIRARDGGEIWSHAHWTSAGAGSGATGAESRRTDSVRFEPVRTWRSLRTGAQYPVQVSVRAFERTIDLYPLIDDQELDARASTGTVYWEGAVRAVENGREIGRGYLELTGYASPVRF
ncbi:MAG TPA: lipocalin-like domain-containing protein [Burkholderiaceae bacterium]